MNTARVNAAAGVIHAAMQQGRTLPAALAVALECAQLLQSPAPATAGPAVLTEEQVELLADAANRLWADANHEDLCCCSDWPERCVGGHWVDEWRSGAVEVGMPAVIGLWESWRAAAESAELTRLRARVTELEAKVAAVNDLRIAAIDKGDSVRAELDRTRGAAGIAVHRINANAWHCEADAATAIGIRNEVEAIRQQPVADLHEGPEHHAYRLGRDLPEYPVTPAIDQPALAHQEEQ